MALVHESELTHNDPNPAALQSSGSLELERPWDSYTDDHLGLMDHLGIEKFMVLGFCIGGPFIWNLLRRAPDRIAAALESVRKVRIRPCAPLLGLFPGSGLRRLTCQFQRTLTASSSSSSSHRDTRRRCCRSRRRLRGPDQRFRHSRPSA